MTNSKLIKYEAACRAVADTSQIPSTSGIYFFLSPDDTCLYVGCAKNLRRRLNGSHHRWYLWKIATLYIYPCKDFIVMERQLIGEMHPTHQRKFIYCCDPFFVPKNKKTFDEVFDDLFGSGSWIG